MDVERIDEIVVFNQLSKKREVAENNWLLYAKCRKCKFKTSGTRRAQAYRNPMLSYGYNQSESLFSFIFISFLCVVFLLFVCACVCVLIGFFCFCLCHTTCCTENNVHCVFVCGQCCVFVVVMGWIVQ